LVVKTQSGNSSSDALGHQAAHSHDSTMTRVAIEHDRDRDTVRDPPADRYTFGHARNTYIR
jgi:hypothetical protein